MLMKENYKLLMQTANGKYDLSRVELGRTLFKSLLGLEVLEQVTGAHVVHDEVEPAGTLVNIVQADDERMSDLQEDLLLIHQTVDVAAFDTRLVDNLDRKALRLLQMRLQLLVLSETQLLSHALVALFVETRLH